MPDCLVAKAKVAGSNPVFRSNKARNQAVMLSPGLSFRLRHPCLQRRAGIRVHARDGRSGSA